MGYELGKLGLKREGRGLCGIDRRYLVEQIGQPHEAGVILRVEAPDGVVDRLVADVDLFGQGLLGEVHEVAPMLKSLLNL